MKVQKLRRQIFETAIIALSSPRDVRRRCTLQESPYSAEPAVSRRSARTSRPVNGDIAQERMDLTILIEIQ